MTFKTLLKHPLFPSVIGEAAFPFLGFFLWDWNLFYIMMFYAADILANSFFVGVKLKWIVFPPEIQIKTQSARLFLKKGIVITSLIGFASLIGFVLGISYAFYQLENNVLEWEVLTKRFFKEEFLILLVLPIARWFEFILFFKMRRRYLSIKAESLIKVFGKNQFLIICFSIFAVALSFLSSPELIIISMGVAAKLCFDLWKLSR